MAVALDATGTESTLSGASISYTGLTIGSGLSNSAAVFVVVWGGGSNITFSSPTWNSVSAPQIINKTGATAGIGVALFGIVAPASGNQTFAVTPSVTTGNEFYVYGVSFSNVDQTGGATTFAHSAGTNNASTTSLADTITTTNGNYTMMGGCIGTGSTTSTIQLSAVATQDWFKTDGAAGICFGAAGKSASSGSSAAWTVHNSSPDFAVAAGVDIVAAAAAAQTPYQPYFQQMLASKRKPFVGWREGYDHRWRRWRRERGLIVPNRMTIKRAA